MNGGEQQEQNQPSSWQRELVLFAEREEAFQCIDQLTADGEEDGRQSQQGHLPQGRASSLARLRTIFDKYLECPTLLDPSLEALVTALANKVLDVLACTNVMEQASTTPTTAVRSIQFPLSALYTLSKVRGYKIVGRFLPHGVAQVEIIWQAQQSLCQYPAVNGDNELEQPSTLPPLWESLYMLRHWLSILSLVPFGASVFENTDGFTVDRVLQSAQEELDQAGPVREAAAACLSAWLSRPDAEDSHLPTFVSWAKSVIESHLPNAKENSSLSSSKGPASFFCLLGVCQTLAHLLKRSSVARSQLTVLLEPLWEPLLVLADSRGGAGAADNLLLRKLFNKWWTRMSCAHLPPRVATWRYQRGQRSLLDEPAVGQGVTTTTSLAAESNRPEELFFVPDLVEDAMGRLLEALGHSSTVVRWSAAKGVGRITERLPSLCAQDVLDALLLMFEDAERDQAWHGACLTLAELARRGLLLPSRLGDVIPHLVAAVHYNVRRGSTSVGAHVRDAACYTFWAFARAYSPLILRGHLQPLAEAVVLTSLFDREVNCRRAASAAFQEAVGRQGSVSFPNGIAIVTAADYFSLGNRKEAYTTIAMEVAIFEEYRLPILKHLYQEKLFHWDVAIRKLASVALAQLSTFDTAFLGRHAMPFLLEKSLDSNNLHVRHGAVLGVAELTRAFTEQNVLVRDLSEDCRTLLIALVGEIDKRRLYRGRGGEIMRSATCRLVECLAISKLPVAVKDQVKMLDTVDASISHPSGEVQECACSALGKLLSSYFPVGEKGPSPRLQARVVDKFVDQLRTSDNVAVTRGYALALGFLPPKLLAVNSAVLNSIFVALRDTARPDARVGSEGYAETRRNAIVSFTRIVETMHGALHVTTDYPVVELGEKHVEGILCVYMAAMNDYNTDRRGDVGSWCRAAAMRGLVGLLTEHRPSTEIVEWTKNQVIPTRVVGEFLKQMGEKLDSVRLCAKECLEQLINDDSLIIERKKDIKILFSFGEDDYKWAEPALLFPKILAIATMECEAGSDGASMPYFESVIAGITISSGGLAANINNDALKALINFAKQLKETTKLQSLGDSFLGLLQKHTRQSRVVVPVLKTLEVLLMHQCFDPLIQGTSEFADLAGSCLEQELLDCSDIMRLMLMTDVTCALLRASPSNHDTEKKLVGLLCRQLHSQYPRIRSHVSQQLYVVLHDQPHLLTEQDSDVLDLIIETAWGSELEMQIVDQHVRRIADMLHVVELFG